MLEEIFEYLCKFFKDDPAKVGWWLETKNPIIGWVRPISLIKRGRIKKLWEFVRTARIENGD